MDLDISFPATSTILEVGQGDRNPLVLTGRIMYVLCPLAVLTIHSLFKSRHKSLEPGCTQAGNESSLPRDGSLAVGEESKMKGLRCDGVDLEQIQNRKAVPPHSAKDLSLGKRRNIADHAFTEEGKLDVEVLCQCRLRYRHRGLENVPDSRNRMQVRKDGERVVQYKKSDNGNIVSNIKEEKKQGRLCSIMHLLDIREGIGRGYVE